MVFEVVVVLCRMLNVGKSHDFFAIDGRPKSELVLYGPYLSSKVLDRKIIADIIFEFKP